METDRRRGADLYPWNRALDTPLAHHKSTTGSHESRANEFVIKFARDAATYRRAGAELLRSIVGYGSCYKFCGAVAITTDQSTIAATEVECVTDGSAHALFRHSHIRQSQRSGYG